MLSFFIIDMPEDINFEDMKGISNYLFKGIKAIIKNYKE